MIFFQPNAMKINSENEKKMNSLEDTLALHDLPV